MNWYDKRDVFLLSTIHGTSSVEVRRRGDDTPFPKPTMIDEYNNYMGDVDKLDQLVSRHTFTKNQVQVYSNTRVPTQVNTSQNESTRV